MESERDIWCPGTVSWPVDGCEMLFCPAIMVPSARMADMWWEKLVLMAGRTEMDDGTAHILLRR